MVHQRLGELADRHPRPWLWHAAATSARSCPGRRSSAGPARASGRARTRPATPTSGRHAWTTAIPGYESSVNSYHQERIFADVSQPLVRPASATWASLQATPGSQYWDGKKLFVRLGGWGSTSGASLDPNDHTIEIPYYKGLLVASGSKYVQIYGFDVRHTTMGVGFTGDSQHGLVQDVDASYNYTMGLYTQSSYNTFRRVTGTRNTIQLIKLDDGADHNLVDAAVATQNMGQGIKVTGAGANYNTVQNSTFSGGRDVPLNQGQYGGYVQGIDIEQGANHNTFIGNTIERNRRGLMLYQIELEREGADRQRHPLQHVQGQRHRRRPVGRQVQHAPRARARSRSTATPTSTTPSR